MKVALENPPHHALRSSDGVFEVWLHPSLSVDPIHGKVKSWTEIR